MTDNMTQVGAQDCAPGNGINVVLAKNSTAPHQTQGALYCLAGLAAVGVDAAAGAGAVPGGTTAAGSGAAAGTVTVPIQHGKKVLTSAEEDNIVDDIIFGHVVYWQAGENVEDIMHHATVAYVDAHESGGYAFPSLERSSRAIRQIVQAVVRNQNSLVIKGDVKLQASEAKNVTEEAAALLVAAYDNIMLFHRYEGKAKKYEICVRQDGGVDNGIWLTSADATKQDDSPLQMIANCIRRNNNPAWLANFQRQLIAELTRRGKICRETFAADGEAWRKYVPVNNGVWFREERRLVPWGDPEIDGLRFLWKWRVNYNPAAQDVNYNGWSVNGWIRSLFEGSDNVDDRVAAFWEEIQSFICPTGPWRKVTFCINEKGQNGKSTFMQMMRNFGNCQTIRLEDFGKDFGLEVLPDCCNIWIDDIDKGTYVDSTSAFKSIISHEQTSIGRKFLKQVEYKYMGRVICNCNGYPRFKNPTDEGLIGRVRCIRFYNRFTGAKKDTRIKDIYINQRDTLEYLLRHVLEDMPILYGFTDYPCMEAEVEDYRERGDSVTHFLNEVLDSCKWNFLPYTFLYALYRGWMKKYANPRANVVGCNTFNKILDGWVERHNDRYMTAWYDKDRKKRYWINTEGYLREPEILIEEYDVSDWKNKRYLSSPDRYKRCVPDTDSRYTGIVRYSKETEDLIAEIKSKARAWT